jgi:hypothetical protein
VARAAIQTKAARIDLDLAKYREKLEARIDRQEREAIR